MTPNERHALEALEATAVADKGGIEVKFPGVAVVFEGPMAVEFVGLMRRSLRLRE